LPTLQTLNVSKNLLTTADSIHELSCCVSLETLDLSNNFLQGEDVLDSIAEVPSILSFKLAGNPVMSAPQLRKRMICRIPRLVYLDRPIFEIDRLAAEAWGRGGLDAENDARERYKESRRKQTEQEQIEFREWKASKVAMRAQPKDEKCWHKGAPLEPNKATENIFEVVGSEVSLESPDAVTFWSSEFVPNTSDAAQFRAPSYTPDPIDYVERPLARPIKRNESKKFASSPQIRIYEQGRLDPLLSASLPTGSITLQGPFSDFGELD
jgi:hypothetical protein